MSTSPEHAKPAPGARASMAGEEEEPKPAAAAEEEQGGAPPAAPEDAALLACIDRFEAALAAKDIDAAMECVTPNVTWHADLVTLKKDLHGRGALRAYLQAYPNAYAYEHVPLGKCADGLAGFGFSWAVDKGVTPKEGGPHGDQAADSPPTDTLSSTYFVFERPAEGSQPPEGGFAGGGGAGTTPQAAPPPSPLISDLFCQRGLTPDELVRKLGASRAARPAGARVLGRLPLEQLKFGSASSHNEDRARAHAQAAEAVNEAWRTGDPAGALPYLADDAVYINALMGTEVSGRDAWAAMLQKIFRRYTLLWHSSASAVTPGCKACIFFTAAAKYEQADGTSEFVQPSGQSLLLFNDDDKISTMLSFFTPLTGQRGRLIEEGGGGGGAVGAKAGAGGEEVEMEGVGAGSPPAAEMEGKAAGVGAEEEAAPLKAAEA